MRSFIVCTAQKYYPRDQIDEHEL